MPDPERPSPRRKRRAGVTVVVIVLLIVVVVFVLRNIQHAQDMEETQPETAVQTN